MPTFPRLIDLLGDYPWLLTVIFGLFMVMLLASVLVVRCFLLAIPPDYFSGARQPIQSRRRAYPVLRGAFVVSRNLLGALLILAGLVMLFTPGQGMLTLLLGVSVAEFPGKRTLERWLIGRPMVLALINQLRARANRPPLTT